MTDDLRVYLMNRGERAVAVLRGLATTAGPSRMNMLFRTTAIRSASAIHRHGVELGGNLWYLFFAGTAPGEMERFCASAAR